MTSVAYPGPFDEQRGVRSGRVVGADGTVTFVLGAVEAAQLAYLAPGDYTEVSQVVDLTGIDLVGADMASVGRTVATYHAPAGWADDVDALAWWALTRGASRIPSRIAGGPALVEVGAIERATETYSPDGGTCRSIPAGTTTAYLIGTNNPPAIPEALDGYTLEWWMNWAGYPTIPASSGFGQSLFQIADETDGLVVTIDGVTGPGAHAWHLSVLHLLGGSLRSVAFVGHTLDGPTGWRHYAITWSSGQAPNLYVDGVFICSGTAVMPYAVGAPTSGAEITYGGPLLACEIDALRLLWRVLSEEDVAAERAACVIAPDPVELHWSMSVLIDGVPFARRDLGAGEARSWTDFWAPVRQITGTHRVAFRLSLETVVEPELPS